MYKNKPNFQLSGHNLIVVGSHITNQTFSIKLFAYCAVNTYQRVNERYMKYFTYSII